MIVGYHASQEDSGPADLFRDLRRAQVAGFDAGMSSDDRPADGAPASVAQALSPAEAAGRR